MLKVIATTAPHWIAKKNIDRSISLNSRDPYSLYNAIRYAADMANNKVAVWGESNWNTFEGRMESIILFEYYENQKKDYINLLNKISPNLLLIGSMTIGFAGAIEIAKIAKEIFGDSIFIVIGGKHIIETVYKIDGKIFSNGNSCLELMKLRKIPPVFDLVISGDGEEVIFEIGNIIGEQNIGKLNDHFYEEIYKLKRAKGNWIAGWLDKNNDCKYLTSNGIDLNQDELPMPMNLFGLQSNFPIFQSKITAHTYSYLSKGCPFNCFFCSEKNTINGNITQTQNAPERLYKQFHELFEYGIKNKIDKVSAFVEDSVLLGGNVKLFNRLNALLSESYIKLSFGCQMTSDLLLKNEIKKSIKDLSFNGLSYIFIGLETNNSDIASKMSKNTIRQKSWIEKYEEIIGLLNDLNIKSGFSILFGLGEKHEERIELLNQLNVWQKKFGAPHVVSLNFATKHPLQNYTLVQDDYIKWGTSLNSPLLPIFTELFGEASEKYIMPDTTLPTAEEFLQIADLFSKLNLIYQ